MKVKIIVIIVIICWVLPFAVTAAVTGIHKKKAETETTGITQENITTYISSVRTISYLKEEAVHILRKKYGEIFFEDGLDNAFQIIERDTKGNVVEVMAGNVVMSGELFAEIMKLGSANFRISVNSTEIIFTVVNE